MAQARRKFAMCSTLGKTKPPHRDV